MEDSRNPSRGLSRRTLLGAALGTGVVVTAGGLLLPGDGPVRRALREAAEGPPRQGGRIRAACMSLSTGDTLDPAKGSLSSDYVRHFMLYNCLTELDRDQRAVPSLAQAIESNDQALWHITLRKGVTFHDGKSLTSADVVYSLLRHKNPATASKLAAIAEQFTAIEATGPLTLTIQLAGPNADLPVMLAQSHFAIIADGEKRFTGGNGTGPYRMTAFTPGVRTLVQRNRNYWKPGKPYLDEIELIGIPDEVSRVNALLSGDVHMVLAVNARSTQRIAGSARHIVRETPSSLYSNLIMRQDQLPTSNPHFVAGIKQMMDRPLIKRALFRDYATIANDQPIPPFHTYYRADLPQTTLDLDKARWHFAKAGIGTARLPIFASPAAEGSVDMASILQEYGARAGLNLAVNRVPADGYWSTHWMKHPLGFGNTNPRPTADLIFSLFYKSDAAWNESGWKNPRFDSLLLEARGEADEARRKQLYGEMQGLVRDHCGVGIPVFISLLDGYDRRLKGWYPVPLGGFMGYGFAEHLWWED
ncbi:ABC transporter substrate-binding protein [Novosphingobium sp. P6W]|uniref:ABC transporter substrate-binding protein n=1 Tax=Novosphingobium sp. P6W TaxID=1609758 RepID=UPI0005C3128F|nr:ABC transporter substrate-binding protein [Novosphingobium sp. P6W]AXB78432.1 ABC transporter substrate-binding protein [Novosphingobium sp. P6W]KIS32369.1 ABC transporter substrate-binding protein [Novosphingobium sp. P6W]